MDTDESISLIADFRITSRLAEGGNGTFFLATPPPRLNLAASEVVLKVFDGACSEENYRRGVRELRAFAAVDSPYLANLYDAVLQERFMYAMEYFPLGSLDKPAEELTTDAVLAAVEDAARGVDALHEVGIAHGNVTPEAIMVTPTGAKLADLGLARILSDQDPLTSFGRPASVQYMDPALLADATPSRATDIWSLGACLHRGLSGTGLYGVLPEVQPILAIRTVLSKPPRIADGLDPRAVELIVSCLRLEGHSMATAGEVADAIAAIRQH